MKASRMIHLLVAIFLVTALLPIQAPVQAQSGSSPEVNADSQFVPGELLVGFEAGMSTVSMDARASALAGSVGAEVAKTYANMALLSLDPEANLDPIAQQLRAQIGVQYVERNYIRKVPAVIRSASYQMDSIERQFSNGDTMEISIDRLKAMRSQVKSNNRVRTIPTYPKNEWLNWGSSRIGHEIIWSESSTSPWVCVADTGVDARHPDLKGRIVNGYDFINADSVPQDDFGHGTHVAGIITGKVNSNTGPAGISNGKVLAVKVLGAQGWGTDFDVASGIRYCANNSYVKVINLSLGGGDPSLTIYSALDYAINTKGKLVVAAAGNSSTSVPEYPAAWASTTIPGMLAPGDVDIHPIAQGMLSVGAARPTDYPYILGQDPWAPVWVDTNGDGVAETWVDKNENGYVDGNENPSDRYSDCAAEFTNYGNWVEVVAPGDAIWSTLPVSYPYYSNYFFGDGTETPGYASWGGTSMAAAHVSGAAARIWSINKKLNNAAIHDLVIDNGSPLTFAVDPNVTDPTLGFDADRSDSAVKNGYQGEAPFCWPDATYPFTAEQDMSNAVYINVAASMNRGILSTMAYNSVTGLPLTGAKIQAVNYNTGAVKATSIVGPSTNDPWADLINLPASNNIVFAEDGSISSQPPYYNLRISKSGYTYGYQYYEVGMLVLPGEMIWDPWMGVAAVPPKKSTISVVAQWWHDDDPFESYGGTGAGDIDMYVWLPEAQNDIVGPEKYGSDPYSANPYSETGTLVTFPLARYHRDGGWGPAQSGGLDWVNIETIEIKNRLSKAYYPGDYKIFLTNNSGPFNEINDASPILSVWRAGKVIGLNFQAYDDNGVYSVTDPGYCDEGENWWYAGRINGSRFLPEDLCGPGGDPTDPGSGSILPYWIAP